MKTRFKLTEKHKTAELHHKCEFHSEKTSIHLLFSHVSIWFLSLFLRYECAMAKSLLTMMMVLMVVGGDFDFHTIRIFPSIECVKVFFPLQKT